MTNTPNSKMEVGYNWRPIIDLPENWQTLSDPELDSLARVWAEQHNQLKESQAVEQFNERLLREWSIETGILERLYTIDQGVTQLLVERGIDSALIPHGATDLPVAEVVRIIKDHRDALEGLFDFVSSRQALTTSYIRQLHQVITRSQKYVEGEDQFGNVVRMELLRGDWKKWPNNPKRPDGLIHEYCPPLQVAGEMDRLVAFFNAHETFPPEIIAAWLHHRFTQIHPFQDGNGRVARALATLVFLRAGWFPLVINRDQRGDYITALESADQGDLTALVKLFGQNAKQAFARALTLSEDVLQGETALPRVVDTLVNVYQTRRQETEKIYQQVEDVASQLCREANRLLREISLEIHQKFVSISSPPLAMVSHSKQQNDFYYAAQIITTAKELEYWANVSRRRMWVRLLLLDQFNEQRTHIVFSFHYYGKVNRGIMVCTAFIYFPEVRNSPLQERTDEGETEPQFGETHRVCNEPFYFSYTDRDHVDRLITGFQKWVNEALSVGLAEWAQRL